MRNGYNPKVVTAYFKDCGLPEPLYEIRHIPKRKFRLDIGWPHTKVGIEVQGGLWISGKHARGSGVKKDMEKRNLQLLNGWKVLEVEPKDLCIQETVAMVLTLMERRDPWQTIYA